MRVQTNISSELEVELEKEILNIREKGDKHWEGLRLDKEEALKLRDFIDQYIDREK